jgi:hypothetical protein
LILLIGGKSFIETKAPIAFFSFQSSLSEGLNPLTISRIARTISSMIIGIAKMVVDRGSKTDIAKVTLVNPWTAYGVKFLRVLGWVTRSIPLIFL